MSGDDRATSRDRAEAAADDLWDATVQLWALVRDADRVGLSTRRLRTDLIDAGHYLNRFSSLLTRHDREIARLFEEDADVGVERKRRREL